MNKCDEIADFDNFFFCVSGVTHQNFLEYGADQTLELCTNRTGRVLETCARYASNFIMHWSEDYSNDSCSVAEGSIPDEFNICESNFDDLADIPWSDEMHDDGHTH